MTGFRLSSQLMNPGALASVVYANQIGEISTANDTEILYYDNGAPTSTSGLALTSTGGSAPYTLSLAGSVDATVGYNVNGSTVLSETALGSTVLGSSLESTTSTNFQVGSGSASFVPVCVNPGVKIDQGFNTANIAAGTQGFSFAFTNVPQVFAQAVFLNNDNQAYFISVTLVNQSGFNYKKNYSNDGPISLAATEDFNWLAIGA